MCVYACSQQLILLSTQCECAYPQQLSDPAACSRIRLHSSRRSSHLASSMLWHVLHVVVTAVFFGAG